MVPDMPTVSVIIPCYNQGHYLPDALDSVLAQTYPDWEAIVVDDGSTDNTAAVVAGYAERDPRMRYVHQDNAGPAAARNRGLSQGDSRFVCFLDADDWWDRGFLLAMTYALTETPLAPGVAFADWAYVDDAGSEIAQVCAGPWSEGAFATLVKRNPLAIHCAMIRREALLGFGGVPAQVPALEDWEMWLRLAIAGYGFVHVAETLAFYRWRTSSRGKDPDRRRADRLATLDRLWRMADLPADVQALKQGSYSAAHADICVSLVSYRRVPEAAGELLSVLVCDPPASTLVDVFYRMAWACTDVNLPAMPTNGNTLDMAAAETVVKEVVDHVCDNLDRPHASVVRSTAYQALAMVAYQQRRLRCSRSFWLRALRFDPKHVTGAHVSGLARALARSALGQEASAL